MYSLKNAFITPQFRVLSPRHGVVIVWEHYFPEASTHLIVFNFNQCNVEDQGCTGQPFFASGRGGAGQRKKLSGPGNR